MHQLGFNPLNISEEDMEEIEISDEEAKFICLALQHVTVYVPFGEVIRPNYLSKFSLINHVSSDTTFDPDIITKHQILKLKKMVKSRVSCSCTCCINFTTYPDDLQRIIFNCRELDTSEQAIKDQNGSQVLAGLMEFAPTRSKINNIHCKVKSVNLEVAFNMLTETGATYSYCAIPDFLARKHDETTSEVVAAGEVASSPANQTYLAAMGYLARDRNTSCV